MKHRNIKGFRRLKTYFCSMRFLCPETPSEMKSREQHFHQAAQGTPDHGLEEPFIWAGRTKLNQLISICSTSVAWTILFAFLLQLCHPILGYFNTKRQNKQKTPQDYFGGIWHNLTLMKKLFDNTFVTNLQNTHPKILLQLLMEWN